MFCVATTASRHTATYMTASLLQQFKERTAVDPALMECFGKLFGAGALDDTTEVVHSSQAARITGMKQITALLQVHRRATTKPTANPGLGTSARLNALAQSAGPNTGKGHAPSTPNHSLALHRREQYSTLQEEEGVAEAAGMGRRSTLQQVQAGLQRFHGLGLDDASELVLHLQAQERAARAHIERKSDAVRAAGAVRKSTDEASPRPRAGSVVGSTGFGVDTSARSPQAVSPQRSRQRSPQRTGTPDTGLRVRTSASRPSSPAPSPPPTAASAVAEAAVAAEVEGPTRALIAMKYLPAVSSMAARLHGAKIRVRGGWA